MVNKIREVTVPTISYLNDVKGGDVSETQDVQRRFCSDNSFINGIGVTVLTADYLPPIILGEIPIGQGMVQQYIVDAMQRTSALMKIRFGNYRFTSAIEGNEIEYQEKLRDENGRVCKDDEGNVMWEQKTFNIKGKTFDDLPEELKKRFDNFQLRMVVHENCTMQRISELIRRYNNHRAMNTSQKGFTYLDIYARKVKTIVESDFFKESIEISDSDMRGGVYEKIICESVMTVFHLDKWTKTPKNMCSFLNKYSNELEFDTIHSYFDRVSKVCGDLFKRLFVNKDIAVWMAAFHHFTKLGMEDIEFTRFLSALVEYLHGECINEDSYDSLYKLPSTKDKSVINKKINYIVALMNRFFGEQEVKEDVSVEQFVAECIGVDTEVIHEDLAAYEESLEMLLDETVKVDSKLRNVENHNSLLAMMAYSYKEDIDLDEWLSDYAKTNNTYCVNQKKNFEYMKNDLLYFVNNKNVRITA